MEHLQHILKRVRTTTMKQIRFWVSLIEALLEVAKRSALSACKQAKRSVARTVGNIIPDELRLSFLQVVVALVGRSRWDTSRVIAALQHWEQIVAWRRHSGHGAADSHTVAAI